jgi:transposase
MDREHRMLDARILQAQGYKQAEIAAMLGVCERTVRYYLSKMPSPRASPIRASRLDPFKKLILSQLEENPGYNGELIFERIVRMGYTGKKTILKAFIAKVRQKITATAVMRFETEPGHQAQVDWKEFGKQVVDGRERKLYAFVMVLGYSRTPFVRFTTDMRQSTLLACHSLAFAYFGGVPNKVLYDNMRTAYRPDPSGSWRPTKRLSALAVHYGFVPRHCKIRRPETKGKVERAIGYLDQNFWPRMAGQDLSLDALNEQVLDWVAAIASKPIAELGESRHERFERERSFLSPLPAGDFDARDIFPLVVNRESTVRHETNRYSVPPEHIATTVLLYVHPLTRKAELVADGRSVRQFSLAESGSRSVMIFEEDRAELKARWDRDRSRLAIRRSPRRRTRRTVDVEVRSPTVYDVLVSLGEVGA